MSSVNYRINARRRRNWRGVIIVTAVILVFLVGVFLVVGNLLKEKTDETPSNGSGNPSQKDTQIDSFFTYSVNSYGVDISSGNISVVSESISSLRNKGVGAVSVNLSDKDGRLLYNSKVAQSFGYQSSGYSSIDPKDLASRITSFGALPTGTLVLNSQNEEDPKVRIVKVSYESALVAEIAEKGIRDITLICDKVSLENVDELLRLAQGAKSVCSEMSLGITLPLSAFADPQAAVLIDRLTEGYDFVALKLNENGDTELCDYIEGALSDPNVRYCFIRYNVRLLIPTISDGETFEELMGILMTNSVKSWQMIC